MVKKLFKHEFAAYWRVLLPAWIALMGVSVLGRLIQLFEQDSTIYEIVSGSSVVFYVIAIVAAFAFPFVYAIIRFYRNLFTGEGYLTFTLPVTPTQHIWVKVLTAVALQVLSLLVICLSATIMTAGELLVEIWKAIVYLLDQAYLHMGGHLVWFIIEAVLLLLVLLVYEALFFDTCITIGQLFRKNRVLAAVGVYFGFYVIEQVVGTCAIIVAAFINWDSLMLFVSENLYLCAHLGMWLLIVGTAVLGAVFYVVTHHIISKRLNLE